MRFQTLSGRIRLERSSSFQFSGDRTGTCDVMEQASVTIAHSTGHPVQYTGWRVLPCMFDSSHYAKLAHSREESFALPDALTS